MPNDPKIFFFCLMSICYDILELFLRGILRLRFVIFFRNIIFVQSRNCCFAAVVGVSLSFEFSYPFVQAKGNRFEVR